MASLGWRAITSQRQGNSDKMQQRCSIEKEFTYGFEGLYREVRRGSRVEGKRDGQVNPGF